MTDDYKISEEPPRDDQGHPIHPERGHRICGATKSDRTTPTSHGRERDEYDYCLLAAGWGEDRKVGPCSKHPITGEQWGESNPNHKHGGYSKFFSEADYTKDEKRRVENAYEAIDDPEERDEFLRWFIGDLLTRYGRTRDVRYARELRQSLAEFGFTPEEARQLHVEHSGSVDVEHDVPEHVVEAIAGAAEANLEGRDES